MDEERDTPALDRTPATMMLAITILAAAGVALGLLPQARAAFEAAGQQFTDRAGYIAQALGHASHGDAHPVLAGRWTVSGIGYGLLSVALAIIVAGLGLYPSRLPPAVRAALSPAAAGGDRAAPAALGAYRGLRRLAVRGDHRRRRAGRAAPAPSALFGWPGRAPPPWRPCQGRVHAVWAPGAGVAASG